VTGAPIVFLLLVRILHRRQPAAARAVPRAASGAAHPDLRRHAGTPVAPPALALPAQRQHRDDHARRARPRPAIAEETA
jgi:hypothetical protein